MSKVSAFIHGIYPRSQSLVKATRDLDRGRNTNKDFRNKLRGDFENLIKIQKEARFDYLESGLLNWADIFRPIVEATAGMETTTLTRWFDNNTFYRQPQIRGKLHLDEKKLKEFFPACRQAGPPVPSNWKVTLPSPFTFAKLTDDKNNSNFEKTLLEITQILSMVLAYLKDSGVSFVQFNEPYLVYHRPENKDIALFNKYMRQLLERKNGLKVAVSFYFGDVGGIINRLDVSLIDVLGIDFYKTALSSLPKEVPSEISAGLIDGRNSLLEDEKVLINFVESLIDRLDPNVLYITNNSDLELLPAPVAAKKIKLISKVRKHFNL